MFESFSGRVACVSGMGRWKGYLLAAGLIAAVAFSSSSASAQTYWWNPKPWLPGDATPAFRTLRGVPVTPAAAATYFGSATTSTNGLCRDLPSNADFCSSGVTPRAPELKELAKALHNDPDLIYEYVRNGVETEFLFGAHKGALGTYIDRSGTAFDQSMLMVELLKEAGLTARYRYGDITLTGAEFLTWTGIQKARAACEMLAAGGIPAIVNNGSVSNGSDCDVSGNVGSVVMSHAWVEIVIGGQAYQFDPAYKPHDNKAGIDVKSAMGLVTGEAFTVATTGSSQSMDGKTVSGLNASALSTKVEAYTDALQTRFRQPDMNGAAIEDVVGGQEIVPATRPTGGLRQTSLAYVTNSRATWSDGVPDQYRAVATITGQFAASGRAPISASLFTDEVYGRCLELEAWWPITGGIIGPPGSNRSALLIDRRMAQEGPQYGTDVTPEGDNDSGSYAIGLALNHPFAASSGAYGDATINRRVNTGLVAIALGFGRTSPRLGANWSNAVSMDQVYGELDAFRKGALGRSVMGAEWLAQFSQALNLHSRLADGRETHLHTIGFSFGVGNPGGDGGNADRVDLLDLETAIGLTSLENDAAARRAAIHAIAATAATLEGSVAEQRSDSPDSISTARRFAFANGADDEPIPGQSNVFYRINATDAVPALTAFGPSAPPNGMTNDHRPPLLSTITAYHNQGFDLVAAAGTLLGPGAMEGSIAFESGGNVAYPSTQRGGAFIAMKYDANGDPTEIAHIPTSYLTVSKGGGGNALEFLPKETAASLKDRFVDRSSAVGVDLKSGSVGYTGPVVGSVGQGDFPNRLEETLSIRGGGIKVFDAQRNWSELYMPPQTIEGGLVSNFDGAARFSGSGLEAMGASRLEAAAPTLAAFAAMQDIYRAAPEPKREIAGLLAADWLGRRMIRNVLTVTQGGGAEQYIEVGVEGAAKLYLPSSGGGGKALVASGPLVVRPFPGATDEGVGLGFRGTYRIKLDETVDVSVFDASGAKRTYQPWRYGKYEGTADAGSWRFSFAQGLRLSTWSFPNGVALTINYGMGPLQTTPAPGNPAIPISVTSNLGLTLTLSTAPMTGYVTAASCNHLAPNGARGWVYPQETFYETFADASGGTTKLKFEQSLAWTTTQRPVDRCRLTEIYTPGDAMTPALRYSYDTVDRVKEARDGVAIREPLTRGPHQFFIAHGYRGERLDPEGGRYVVETLRGGRLVRNIDELDRVVTSIFDGRGRVLSRTYPEGDTEAFTYDFRGNMLSLTRTPKPGSGLPPLVSTMTYVEEPTVWNCANIVVCNQPSAMDGPMPGTGDVTSYSWNATTGNLTQVLKPADNAGQRPQIDLGYTGYPIGGSTLSLLTSRTEKIDASTSITTVYTYDLANKYLLKSTTVDQGTGGLNLTTCYQYDANGNPVGISDPRTTTCPATVQ